MKKVFPAIYILLAVCIALTGCDFFRTLAGRPTSSEIEATREVIRQKTAEQQVPEARDTVHAEVQVQEKAPVEPVETAVKEGKKRYYIVMASFASAENASKYAERLSSKGYEPEFLGFKGGYTAVGICGTDDEEEAKASLNEVRRQDFCPEGVWIIDRNKR